MVYVSFSQKDKSIVQRICRNLTEKGVRFFADYEHMAGGDYAQELTKRIEESEAVIFFYINNAEYSTWVKREVEFSISRKKKIIPVLLTDPEPNGWLHYNLGDVNWIRIEENNLENLTEKIFKALYEIHKIDRKTSNTTSCEDKKNSQNIRHTSSSPRGSNFLRPKAIGCGCLIIFITQL